MPFDYKKEYRAFYQPPKVPEIIDVPEMQFVCVSGTGDPNEEAAASAAGAAASVAGAADWPQAHSANTMHRAMSRATIFFICSVSSIIFYNLSKPQCGEDTKKHRPFSLPMQSTHQPTAGEAVSRSSASIVRSFTASG